MKIENRDVTVKDTVSITVQLNNTSAIAGSETVLVYASDVYASITPSVKRLRAFKRVPLDKYEGKEVQIKIAISDLAYVGLDNKFIVEPGKFYINIANLKDSITVK